MLRELVGVETTLAPAWDVQDAHMLSTNNPGVVVGMEEPESSIKFGVDDPKSSVKVAKVSARCAPDE